MLDPTSENNNNKSQAQPVVSFDTNRSSLARARTSQRLKKRILHSELVVPVKEGIQLLEFFHDESNSQPNLRNYSSNKNSSGKTTKFRAEVLYYPIIHGDLKKTEMKLKYRLPNKQDIELERDAVVYRDMYHNKRVYVPSSRTTKEAGLLYKNYSQYDS